MNKRYTADAIIEKCHDLLKSDAVRQRHWKRIAKRINKRIGVTLSSKEVKALVVAAQDFDSIAVIWDSKNIDGDLSNTPETETNVSTDDKGDSITVTSEGIRSVADLMLAAKLDPGEWYADTARPNYWETMRKDGGSHPHFQIKASFKRYPEWANTKIKVQKPPHVKVTEPTTKALFLPDTQHGFRREEDGTLTPMHDVVACALAVAAAKEWQPQEIYLLGDHLDLAPWSLKFARPASLFQTTNASLQAVHNWIAEIRKACPNANIYYCEGNHENRIYRAVLDRLSELEGLKTALGKRPVLSIPNLLHLDELNVEYIAPYGKEHVLWGQVGVSHGTKHGARVGQLISKRLIESNYSWVQGHDHKLASGTKTLHDRGMRRQITGMSPGTLARIDGAVPGVTMYPNWSQGLGFAVRDGDNVHMWNAPILGGAVYVNGKMLKAG
jgi:hypothetical protein